jgi:hypothetical protein
VLTISNAQDVYDIPILGTVLLWTISYFILLKEWVLDNYRNLALLDVQLERIIFGSIEVRRTPLIFPSHCIRTLNPLRTKSTLLRGLGT